MVDQPLVDLTRLVLEATDMESMENVRPITCSPKVQTNNKPSSTNNSGNQRGNRGRQNNVNVSKNDRNEPNGAPSGNSNYFTNSD